MHSTPQLCEAEDHFVRIQLNTTLDPENTPQDCNACNISHKPHWSWYVKSDDCKFWGPHGHAHYAVGVLMAQNGLLCADVPLRNYSLTHSVWVCSSLANITITKLHSVSVTVGELLQQVLRDAVNTKHQINTVAKYPPLLPFITGLNLVQRGLKAVWLLISLVLSGLSGFHLSKQDNKILVRFERTWKTEK